MAYKPVKTGTPTVDKAMTDMARVIGNNADAIYKGKIEFGSYKIIAEKKFEKIKESLDAIESDITAMSVSFQTKTLLVGDVDAGNYIEIKETGEIELHGTNTVQINSGMLYLKNGATVERIRAESGVFYVEKQTGPTTWVELFQGF